MAENSNNSPQTDDKKFTQDKFLSILKKIGLVVLGILGAIISVLLMQSVSDKNKTKEQEAKKNLDDSVAKAKDTANTLQQKTGKAKEDASLAMNTVQTNTVNDRLDSLEDAGIITRKQKDKP